MSGKIFDSTVEALQHSLNLRLANQNVIASNIANADTPDFKAKRMDFERELRSAMNIDNRLALEGGEPEHLPPAVTEIEPLIVEDQNGIASLDGNTVNRADEMARMAENQILYETGIEMMRRKLGIIKYGVNEGGGNR